VSSKHRRNVLLAVCAAVVAAGAIVAIVTAGASHHSRPAGSGAASRSAHPRTVGQLAIAARYLGVPLAELRSRMRSGLSLAQIADATHGKSASGLIAAEVAQTSAQAQRTTGGKQLSPSARRTRLARLRRRIEREANRVQGYVGLPAAARYLGVSATRLRAELESGRSLAQIADATPGKSASGLIEARVSAREATIKQALASGRIGQTTADALLSSLRQRVTGEVQHRPKA
jgi:hypothetical protein